MHVVLSYSSGQVTFLQLLTSGQHNLLDSPIPEPLVNATWGVGTLGMSIIAAAGIWLRPVEVLYIVERGD